MMNTEQEEPVLQLPILQLTIAQAKFYKYSL